MRKNISAIVVVIMIYSLVAPYITQAAFDTWATRTPLKIEPIQSQTVRDVRTVTTKDLVPKRSTSVRTPINQLVNGKANVSESIVAELSVESVHAVDVSSVGDTMVYSFDLEIKNAHPTKQVKNIVAQNVQLSVIDLTNATVAIANGISYKDVVAQYGIYTSTIGTGNTLTLNANQSMTVHVSDITLQKNESAKNILFLLDPTNVVTEYNDQQNQTINSDIVLKENNTALYRMRQPFDQFGVQIDTYDKSTGSMVIETSVPFYGTELEKDLVESGAFTVSTEILNIDGGNVMTEDIVSTNDVENNVTILQSYPNPLFDFGNAPVVDATAMSVSGATLQGSTAVSYDVTKNNYIVLMLTTLSGTKIPLYVTKIDAISTEVDSSEYKNCDYDAGECDYLIFTRTSPHAIDVDNATISDTNPVVASTFEFCNHDDVAGTIHSFTFKNTITTDISSPQVGVKTTATYMLDGKAMWDPITFHTNESMEKDTEIVLDTPLVVYPGDCHELDVQLSSVEDDNLFFVADIKSVNSNIPVFGYDNLQNLTISSGLVDIADEYKGVLHGTLVAFNGDHSVIVDFLPSYAGLDIHNSNPYPYDIINMNIMTNGHQSATIHTLTFHVDSTFSGELPAQIHMTDMPYPWYMEEYYGMSKKIVQDISIPANGDFQVDVQNMNLDFAQKAYLSIFLMPPYTVGELSMSLVAIDSDATNIIENKYHILPSALVGLSSKEFFAPISFPRTNTVHILDPEFIATEKIKVSIEQVSAYEPTEWWYSKHDYELKEKLFTANFDFYDSFNVSSLSFDDWDIEVAGTFDTPLELLVHVISNDVETTNEVTVLPGDIFSVKIPEWQTSNILPHVDIQLKSYPDLELLQFAQVMLIAHPIHITSNGEDVTVYHASFEKNTITQNWNYIFKEFNSNQDFNKLYIMGKEMIYMSGNNNSVIPKTKIISELKEDEQVVMNNVCFLSIGDNNINKITYAHDAHEIQPFDQVILDQGQHVTYLPLQGWSPNIAEFMPSPKTKMTHMSNSCFDLKVQGPTEPLTNTFFNLIGVDAVVENTDQKVPVFVNISNMIELSVDNMVKGTVYNFK